MSLHSLKLKPGPRLVLTLLCLLACTAQSFVAQTHVHARPACDKASFVTLDCGADSQPGKHTRGEPSCPLCQVALHGGAAPLTSDTLSVGLLAQNSIPAPEQPTLRAIAAISYHWQSRGPPLS